MTTARIGFAALATAAALALVACGDSGGAGIEITADDRTMGDPNAPVTVVEYASITCSACKAWHDQVYHDFKEQLVDTGKVRFVFRELPTAPIDVSVAGFLVARCAPEPRYFNVLDTLFDRQERLFTAQARDELVAIARAAGLSDEDFNACIRDEEAIEAMNARIEEGTTRYRVSSTPTFVINGEVIVGAQPLSVFQEAVAEATGEPMPAAEPEETPAEG